jgi:branched-subunit amino acid aminotransferase/4-amino-4-deoxychorismate lyase
MKVWSDGTWNEIEQNALIGTPAFQFGFGLFETMRIKNGQAMDAEDHLGRMRESMRVLDPGVHPVDVNQTAKVASSAAKFYEGSDGVLKVIAFKSENRWEVLFLARPFPYLPSDYERGWSISRSSVKRNPESTMVYHKTLNYLENYLERQKARSRGCDDAYFLNGNGVVTECSAANIFVLHGDRLETSPVSTGILPGIMRAKILDKARRLGIEVKESPISLEVMAASDAVYVTNALLGVMDVSAIDGVACRRNKALGESLNKLMSR